MPDHVWTVVCKDFVVDKESGNVTIFKALEQISFVRISESSDDTPPDNIAYNFGLVTLWTRSDRDKPERIVSRYVFKGPDGKTIGASEEYPVDLKQYTRHRIMSRLPGIGFKGFGRYTFVVQKKLPGGKWSKVAVVPLEVAEGESAES